ncbi:MAG: hypothetical protein IKA51_06495 [Clostridia bacterium]|nr:hypothetical protein [Clostridia bacterium]
MKRFFSIFLTAVLLLGTLSLAACGGSEKVTVEPGPFGKYSPAITVTYGKSIAAASAVLTALEQTPEVNVWNDYIRQELGIKLKLTLGTSTSEDYFEKLVNSIASSNVPEFLEVGYFENGFINLKLMYDNELLADIGEIVKNYASDDLKSIMEDYGDEVLQPCTFDGKLMGFPQYYNVGGASTAFWWIRTDWLDNLNLSMPETFEDLINVANAFANQDPDGNNQKDTYGFAADGAIFNCFAGIFNAYGAHPQAWVEDENGDLVYGGITNEMKQAVTTLKELYANGAIAPNFTELAPGTDSLAHMNAGTAGIMAGVATTGLNLAQTVVRNPNARYECIPFISATGEDVKVISDIPAYSFYAVRNDAKYPEAMIKILNLYIEVQSGERGDELVSSMIQDEAGNEIWKISPVSSMAAASADDDDDKYDQIALLAEAINNKDDSKLNQVDKGVYKSITDYLDKGINRHYGWYALFKENGSMQKLVDAREEDYFIFDKFNAAPGSEMSKYENDLYLYQWTSIASIIVGEEPIDYFDTFVGEWKNLGGDEVTEEVNNWYEQFK